VFQNSWQSTGKCMKRLADFFFSKILVLCTRWRSCLRHCATSQKVAGSIPDGVGIFWHNPSSRTMALELTRPLTDISTTNISWGWRQEVHRSDNLTTFMCRLSWNLGASTSWNPQGLPRPVMGLLFMYFVQIFVINFVFQHTVAPVLWKSGRGTSNTLL